MNRITFFLFVSIALALSTFSCRWNPKFDTASTLAVDLLPPLPDSIGLGGPFAGVHNGALIVAGGANFPNGLPWEGGKKVWYSTIYILEKGADKWKTSTKSLPLPMAYGGSVSTPNGLFLIGGSNDAGAIDHVFRLKWENGMINIDTLPSLPRASFFVSAAQIGNKIYVLPGQASSDPTDVIQAFWTMDLDKTEAGWGDLPGLPGEKRVKVVTAVNTSGGSQAYFYCFSGEIAKRQTDSTFTYGYSRENYRYNPSEFSGNPWEKLADMPLGTAAGTAIGLGQSSILLFGGSNGEYWGKPVPEWPQFTTNILAYHTITDTWRLAGQMSEGTLTTTAVPWEKGIVIPSGEVKPGVRTRAVQFIQYKRAEYAFGWSNYLVLVIYLLGLILLGIYFSRREKTTAEFFLAGKRIPWWAAGLSIYATQLSAITFISVPTVAYTGNLVLTVAFLAIFLMAPIVVKYYLPFFYQLKITTAYEYLEKRFNLAVRLFGSLAFSLFQLARMSIVIYLPALALATATGVDVYLCIFLMAALATVYTYLGGMEAVIWTDVIQVFVLLGGTLITLVLIFSNVGSLDNFNQIATQANKLQLFDWRFSFFDLVTWAVLIGSFFINFGPYTTDQTIVQRYLTTKDFKASARGVWLNGIISLPTGMLFLLVGTALYVFYKMHPESLYLDMQNDEIYPLFIATQMPAGLSGLLIAGIFAASMSSLDSSMHSLATAFTTDFYQRLKGSTIDSERLRLAKRLVLVFGILAMVAAFALVRYDIKSLFFFFQKVIGLLSSGLAGIFFLGIFSTRTNGFGALTGAIISSVVVAYLAFFTSINVYWYAVVGMPVCIITGYFASLLFPGEKKNLDHLTLHTANP